MDTLFPFAEYLINQRIGVVDNNTNKVILSYKDIIPEDEDALLLTGIDVMKIAVETFVSVIRDLTNDNDFIQAIN